MHRWSHGSEAKAPDPDAHHHQKWRQVVDEAVQLRGFYFLVLNPRDTTRQIWRHEVIRSCHRQPALPVFFFVFFGFLVLRPYPRFPIAAPSAVETFEAKEAAHQSHFVKRKKKARKLR